MSQGTLFDIPQPILRIDEVIAGEDAAIVLDGQRLAAKLGGDAKLGRVSHGLGHGRFEQIDQHTPLIMIDLLLEHDRQKGAPIIGTHRPVRDDRHGVAGFAELAADQGQYAVVPELRGRAFEIAGLDAGGNWM